jgi:hypothetical protein
VNTEASVNTETIAKGVLEEVWPNECELVTPITLTYIVKNAAAGGGLENFRATEGGANFTAPEILKLLVESANLVLVCLQVWFTIKGPRKVNPERDKFKEKVLAHVPEGQITEARKNLDAIYEALSKSETESK